MRKVYLAQLDPGFCVSGTKAFFSRHGLDFRDFKANGIDPQKLLDTNDAMAAQLAQRAVEEDLRDMRWEKVAAK